MRLDNIFAYHTPILTLIKNRDLKNEIKTRKIGFNLLLLPKITLFNCYCYKKSFDVDEIHGVWYNYFNEN